MIRSFIKKIVVQKPLLDNKELNIYRYDTNHMTGINYKFSLFTSNKEVGKITDPVLDWAIYEQMNNSFYQKRQGEIELSKEEYEFLDSYINNLKITQNEEFINHINKNFSLDE